MNEPKADVKCRKCGKDLFEGETPDECFPCYSKRIKSEKSEVKTGEGMSDKANDWFYDNICVPCGKDCSKAGFRCDKYREFKDGVESEVLKEKNKWQSNLRDLWAALDMVAETIETIGIVGCMKHNESLPNPEPMTYAEAIKEAVIKTVEQARQSIIAEAIKELPKEKVLQNPPDIDDLGDMRFNMCLSEVKQILERISLSADIKRKENL